MAIPICATLQAISQPPLVTTAAICAAIERAVKARLHQLPVLIFLTSVNSAFHSHRTFEDVEDRAAGARDVAPALRLLGRLADGREEVVEQADGVRHLRRRGHDGEHRGHAADDVEEDLPAPHQAAIADGWGTAFNGYVTRRWLFGLADRQRAAWINRSIP